MKNICIYNNGLVYGGTDTFVANICKNINHEEYDITVVNSSEFGINCSREAEIRGYGANVIHTCALNGVFGKLRHLALLYKILKEGGFYIFQSNVDLFNGPQMFIAWLAGVPVRECHSHNSQQERELKEGRTLQVIVYQRIMRWLCWTFSNRRGGCSAVAMDFLYGDKWKRDYHSKVVHNGIDFSAYLCPLDVSSKRKELGLTKKYNVCTVGRIDYQKNPLFIVDVLNELFKLREDCDFVWVGVGEQETEVRARINEYQIAERMHMLGSRNDVSEILRSCDLFFLPSRFEGLAIVLIEAQVAGLPCVTSTTTTPESNCGSLLYLPLEKPASYWAQQLSDVLDGKIQLHVDAEKLEEYSIDHMVKEMEGLFAK